MSRDTLVPAMTAKLGGTWAAARGTLGLQWNDLSRRLDLAISRAVSSATISAAFRNEQTSAHFFGSFSFVVAPVQQTE